MCGISAIIAPEFPKALKYIHSMNSIIKHRGPDDEGIVFFFSNQKSPTIFGGKDTPQDVYGKHTPYSPQKILECDQNSYCGSIALAHRRLSILDLSSTGHQPMCTTDKQYWIIYNGEIFNYIELRSELEKYGYKFISKSDTEVILTSYAHWGKRCLNKFNGMFAFVIYDSINQKIFAARDRFGIKPLYHWRSPKGFIAIASEIKQFTVLPGWKAKLNGQRAYDFLAWSITEHSKDTLFNNVHQFRGGDFAEFNVDKSKVKFHATNWYELDPIPYSGSFSRACEEFYELFIDSIKLRLRSDVPVGSCLSGGLDSSAIVCSLNQILRDISDTVIQKTFSARAKVKSFDEGNFIGEVVSNTKVKDYHTYPNVKDLFHFLNTIIWQQDEPFNTSSIYAQWKVFHLAALNKVKVMLDGQGADELLAGYRTFFSPLFAGHLKNLRLIKLYREIDSARKTVGLKKLEAFTLMVSRILPYNLFQPMRTLIYDQSTKPIWLNVKALNCSKRNPFDKNNYYSSSIVRLSHSLLLKTRLPMLLHWEDRNSMAHSIEARMPFLDYRLVEFLLGLPNAYKISHGTTKRILRHSMVGILPEKIRTRKDKIGFITPEEIWLKEMVPDVFRKELKRAIISSRGIINNHAEKRLENMISLKTPYNYLVWRMICFGRWMECFNVEI
jgi:asparagine synthase (glutamine-hydrolysing)